MSLGLVWLLPSTHVRESALGLLLIASLVLGLPGAATVVSAWSGFGNEVPASDYDVGSAIAHGRDADPAVSVERAATSAGVALAHVEVDKVYDATRSLVAPNTTGIKTPYGVAEQGTDAGSVALRQQVESGGSVYRQGVTGTQHTADGQFWAGQNPLSTGGYADSYGLPGAQLADGDFPGVMGGTIDSGTPFVTRQAPVIGTNVGGAPEIVVDPGGVSNLWFHMPD